MVKHERNTAHTSEDANRAKPHGEPPVHKTHATRVQVSSHLGLHSPHIQQSMGTVLGRDIVVAPQAGVDHILVQDRMDVHVADGGKDITHIEKVDATENHISSKHIDEMKHTRIELINLKKKGVQRVARHANARRKPKTAICNERKHSVQDGLIHKLEDIFHADRIGSTSDEHEFTTPRCIVHLEKEIVYRKPGVWTRNRSNWTENQFMVGFQSSRKEACIVDTPDGRGQNRKSLYNRLEIGKVLFEGRKTNDSKLNRVVR